MLDRLLVLPYDDASLTPTSLLAGGIVAAMAGIPISFLWSSLFLGCFSWQLALTLERQGKLALWARSWRPLLAYSLAREAAYTSGSFSPPVRACVDPLTGKLTACMLQ